MRQAHHARAPPVELSRRRSSPSTPAVLERPHVLDAEELPQEGVGPDAIVDEGFVKLLGTTPHRPLRGEGGEDLLDLRAVDPVVPDVGPGGFGEDDLAPRHYMLDYVGHIADLVVLLRASHVEHLVVDPFPRALRRQRQRPGRCPRCAPAVAMGCHRSSSDLDPRSPQSPTRLLTTRSALTRGE